jgi:hypothetical protein
MSNANFHPISRTRPLDHTGIKKYAEAMKEIKLRMEVVNLFLKGERNAHYDPTTVETIGLQYRKVFELIPFASLALNKNEYSAVYKDFAKHWEAGKLLKNLEKINPNFYPFPVEEIPIKHPRASVQLVRRKPDYLTKEELIEAHGKCGSLMHAANPFGKGIDYAYFQKSFISWAHRIVNLLNSHQAFLAGDTGSYIVHMQEAGHNEVTWTRTERADPI